MTVEFTDKQKIEIKIDEKQFLNIDFNDTQEITVKI